MENPLDLNHELTIAAKLYALGDRTCQGTHNFGGSGWTQKHKICLSLVDKALNSFASIIILVRNLCPDDATSVLRSLVEVSINAAYIFHKGDSVADDFADFRHFQIWREDQNLRKLPGAKSPYSSSERRKMKRKFDSVAIRFKNHPKDWTNVNLFERASWLDRHYDAQYRKLLSASKFRKTFGREFISYRLGYSTPWRYGSAFVHGTIAAVTRHARLNDAGELAIGRQPTATDAAWVVSLATMTAFQLVGFIAEVLGIDCQAEWNGLYREWLSGPKRKPAAAAV